jgi:CheY-like chemotaxis protein
MRSDQIVFVIDDEEAVRDSIAMMLERRGYAVRAFASAEAYLVAIEPGPGCIVCDVRLDGLSGLDLHRKLIERACDLPVIFITGHGDIEMALSTSSKSHSRIPAFTPASAWHCRQIASCSPSKSTSQPWQTALMSSRIGSVRLWDSWWMASRIRRSAGS